MMEGESGVVRVFQDGEGYIKPDAGGADVYVNWRSCVASWAPRAGDRVKYSLSDTVDGDATARRCWPVWWGIFYTVAG